MLCVRKVQQVSRNESVFGNRKVSSENPVKMKIFPISENPILWSQSSPQFIWLLVFPIRYCNGFFPHGGFSYRSAALKLFGLPGPSFELATQGECVKKHLGESCSLGGNGYFSLFANTNMLNSFARILLTLPVLFACHCIIPLNFC